MKFDFCVTLTPTIHTYLLTTLFFETLIRTTDLSEVTVHVIDKGVDQRTSDYIEEVRAKIGTEFVRHQLDNFMFGPDQNGLIRFNHVYDCAKTCEWMIEKCGSNQWCIISHFDMDFHKDSIQFIRNRMLHNAGQIGQHSNGLVAYNRVAYQRSFVGFDSVAGYFVVNDPECDAHNNINIAFYSDPRYDDKSRQIMGWDVGELYLLSIQGQGWLFNHLPKAERFDHFFHFCGGTTSDHDGDRVRMIRNIAVTRLNEKGIPFKLLPGESPTVW